MLPDNAASSIAVPDLLYDPDARVTSPLTDYELGGVALNDSSQGLRVKVWRAYMDGYNVMVEPEGGTGTLLFSRSGISELALAFDQNMKVAVAFVQNGTLWIYWYDSQSAGYVFTALTAASSPRLALDDKRLAQIANSDIILAYVRENSLYYRQQRDRYLIEYLLRSNLVPGTKLRTIGMGKALRMQFELVLP